MPMEIMAFRLPEESDDHRVALEGWRWRELVRDIVQDWKYNDDRAGAREDIFRAIEEAGLLLWD